ncbi:hypothetical protein FNV43_RR09244 [Rhamnella rubrinervis]|uniref:C2 domain-containing protein n=1 Tax=Rhamnella rubrinervis TaxID=2594499 RepID=A0A8K0H9N8_9ROSA|nr:hypothetical protein FNV43_RR09244 [Rhamnella rubrinervis]
MVAAIAEPVTVGVVLNCKGWGSPPNSLAEYELNQNGNKDLIDISLTEGFNIPMEFSSSTFLWSLAQPRVGVGEFGVPEIYCGGQQVSPSSFKGRCPNAHSYPPDDPKNTHKCPAGSNYRVVFCPVKSPPHFPLEMVESMVQLDKQWDSSSRLPKKRKRGREIQEKGVRIRILVPYRALIDPKMAEGTLEVVLLGAKGLENTDFLSNMDPYCILTCRTQEQKSTVASGKGSEPEWNETFVFTISEGASELTLKILDSDTGTGDDFVGEATIALEPVLAAGNVPATSYNVVKDEEYKGEIRLSLTFTPTVHSGRGYRAQEEESYGGWKESAY